MTTNSGTRGRIGTLKQEGKQAARVAVASPLLEKVMRLGYGVRGLIYGVIGLLAFQVAVGSGGALADQQDAIAAVGRTPLGKILLAVVAIGLAGYAIWGLIRALFDPLQKGNSPKGLIERLGYLVSGSSYGLLLVPTLVLLRVGTPAARSEAQTAQTQQATASILARPGGGAGSGPDRGDYHRGGSGPDLSGAEPEFQSPISALSIDGATAYMD